MEALYELYILDRKFLKRWRTNLSPSEYDKIDQSNRYLIDIYPHHVEPYQNKKGEKTHYIVSDFKWVEV